MAIFCVESWWQGIPDGALVVIEDGLKGDGSGGEEGSGGLRPRMKSGAEGALSEGEMLLPARGRRDG